MRLLGGENCAICRGVTACGVPIDRAKSRGCTIVKVEQNTNRLASSKAAMVAIRVRRYRFDQLTNKSLVVSRHVGMINVCSAIIPKMLLPWRNGSRQILRREVRIHLSAKECKLGLRARRRTVLIPDYYQHKSVSARRIYRTCSLPPVVTPIGNRDKGGARGANESRRLAFRQNLNFGR
jgi:hypothetical protein